MSDQQNAQNDDHISAEPIAVTPDGVAQTTPTTDTSADADTSAGADTSGEHRVVNDDDAGTYTDVDLDPNDDTAAGTA